MDPIAVNVLMDPDAEITARARAVNARLRADFPQGFALDDDHAPHVTLVQCFIDRARLADAAQAVSAALRDAGPVNWQSKATGLYALSDGKLGLAGIVITPTDDFRRVQQRVIDAISPFTTQAGTASAFAPRPDGAAVGQATVDYVKGFIGARTGQNYNTHLTVGIGTNSFVEQLKAEPFEAFPMHAVSVSLYHLGDYGVAQKKLHHLHDCRDR
ncbi:hypothetical protein DK847_08180 [Aestuariivirga litoralis]|uniref:2'-5' RNA ligase family protein n=1 Tax=Aestuariivirga litoralis TaxID=2650924 RepID=A0A2W2APG2_9HYPH|nr:2'-5' RNA ligase family protein [Aestuariivirga litoralis]PZF77291.1 hypothetical protein DK847_08180 [Aestuariivirga litoralis]